MATLAVATAVRAGIDMTGAACSGGGDAFPNTGQEVLFVTNADVAPHTVTVVLQATLDGRVGTNLAVVVGAGKTEAIGPFPQGLYNDVSGLAQVTYSAVTSMTAKVLKVAPA